MQDAACSMTYIKGNQLVCDKMADHRKRRPKLSPRLKEVTLQTSVRRDPFPLSSEAAERQYDQASRPSGTGAAYGSFQKREITASSKQADERTQNGKKISQLTRFLRGDHRHEKVTHRSDKEIGINALGFSVGAGSFVGGILRDLLSTWIYKMIGIRFSIRHPCSQVASMSCYWVSCSAGRNSVDLHCERSSFYFVDVLGGFTTFSSVALETLAKLGSPSLAALTNIGLQLLDYRLFGLAVYSPNIWEVDSGVANLVTDGSKPQS
jgi:fluoride ion exporter CrcB/FEX